MNISIIGAGNVGSRLYELFTKAGHTVNFGVREEKINTEKRMLSIPESIKQADIVLFANPFTAYDSLLPKYQDDLQNKIVIDATNPLDENWAPILLGSENSAGETVASHLPNSKVVKAFNTVFADIMTEQKLNRDGQKVTAFIASDDDSAKDIVMNLAKDCGFAPLDCGPLSSSRYLEAMAHLNIRIAVPLGGGTDAAFVYHQNVN